MLSINDPKRMFKHFLILLILIVLIGVGALIFSSNDKNKNTLSVENITRTDRQELRPDEVVDERERWSRRMDEVGAEQAYEEYKELYAPYDFGAQHTVAHIVGELLYEKKGIQGLSVCDATFAFGCYHSFFGKALADQGTEITQDLDEVCIQKFGPLGTGCQHGIGHGILEYMGHNKLAAALEACKMTTQIKNLFGCTSGVFMEYNFPVIFSPDKTFTETRELNKANPYEPCSTIAPERFRKSCYYEISQWWERVLYEDYEKMGKLCQEILNREHMESCYLGIGNIAAPSSKYNVTETIKKCKKMPDIDTQLLCRAGASWSFFADPKERSKSPEVCRGIEIEEESRCIQKSDLIGNGEKLL